MITEGIGQKSPQQIQISMTLHEQLVTFETAKQRAEHRGYRVRRDQWGQGLKSSLTIPGIGELSRDLRPIYSGSLGEYAVYRYLECRFPGKIEIDWRLTRYGDFGIDLQSFGLKMQVKTRQDTNPINRYRRTNKRGATLPIPSHVCCFCEWNLTSQVYLVGWCWRETIERKPLVNGVGDWKNAELHDTELLPMCRLRDELETWRAARQWH